MNQILSDIEQRLKTLTDEGNIESSDPRAKVFDDLRRLRDVIEYERVSDRLLTSILKLIQQADKTVRANGLQLLEFHIVPKLVEGQIDDAKLNGITNQLQDSKELMSLDAIFALMSMAPALEAKQIKAETVEFICQKLPLQQDPYVRKTIIGGLNSIANKYEVEQAPDFLVNAIHGQLKPIFDWQIEEHKVCDADLKERSKDLRDMVINAAKDAFKAIKPKLSVEQRMRLEEKPTNDAISKSSRRPLRSSRWKPYNTNNSLLSQQQLQQQQGENRTPRFGAKR